jgi:serine/threonine protein kinase
MTSRSSTPENQQPVTSDQTPVQVGAASSTQHVDVNRTMVISNLEVNIQPQPATETETTNKPEFKQVGPYHIRKVIGFGGVGTVYEAVDAMLNRPVALKVLNKKWLDDDVVKERFMREARLCTMIKSPHVPLMHMVGEEDGVPYLAMELLKGFTLDDLMKTSHVFTTMQIIRLGREMAKGMAAAHLMKLIHRDIKPSNIWLETMPDPSGGDRKMFRVKILDFGMARLQEQTEGLTRHGVIVGTPLYMSPEQATAGKVDARTDIFSLGVVLYRLCTGKLPFGGESVADVISNIATQIPPAPRDVNKRIPSKLSKLIMRMLNKNPSDRPPDAMNVARLLEIIEDEEVRLGHRQAAPLPMPPVMAAAAAAGTAVVPHAYHRDPLQATSDPSTLHDLHQQSTSNNPLKPWFVFSVIMNLIMLLALMFFLGQLLKT